jgi:hypothetical protein
MLSGEEEPIDEQFPGQLLPPPKIDPDEEESARAALDSVLESARLYTQGPDFKDLLDFIARMKTFSPFNALLLHVQKPYLSFAATRCRWWDKFGRRIKEGARPLIILKPFGPVSLVYDVLDTEGDPLPRDAFSFHVEGNVRQRDMDHLQYSLEKMGIEILLNDVGDRLGGYIRLVKRAKDAKEYSHYRLALNRNHAPTLQYATLAHELAHLFLGHLGKDAKLRISKRQGLEHAQKELEAESVAYLVCNRQGIQRKAETYLAHFITSSTRAEHLDVYQIVRTISRVEELIGGVYPP